jgi:hypothetical protein
LSAPVVGTDRLRQALLARQLLLERATLDPVLAIDRIGGLQTQAAPSGYVSLWSRVAGFERPWLTHALEDRRVVQGTIMRSTIHTVSAADYWPLTAGVRRVRRAWLERAWGREFSGTDTAALAMATTAALEAGPVRMAELVQRLVADGFAELPARWAGHFVDLVRVPPSGTWEHRRADLMGLAQAWLPPGEPAQNEADGVTRLIRRALGAFGPMTARDLAGWMGFPVRDLAPALARLDLRPLRDEAGRELVDLPEGVLAPADPPAPARFLAVWDPILLVHFRATGILPEAFRPLLFSTRTPQSANAFLLDGQVAGTWRYRAGQLEVEPFRALSPVERRALDEEAHALEAFHRASGA